VENAVTDDFGELLISGSDYQEVSRCLTRIFQTLPPEMRGRFRASWMRLLARYGVEHLQKVNGLTVSQIIAEGEAIDVKPLAEGEVDGVRYALYDAPPREQAKGKDRPAE
jgi:hypothetical protein